MFGKLSWEHVPPAAAYNARPLVLASQEQLREPGLWNGDRGKKQQRGAGAYTLCAKCNNDTGAWYGKEYVEWVYQALQVLDKVPADDELDALVAFRGKPLRFLKQVATMFFSVNQDGFAGRHPELVHFVLDRRQAGLPPRYRFDMVMVRPGRIARSSGMFSRQNLETGELVFASEVAHFPFAFRFIESEETGPRHGPIEGFADSQLDETRDEWVRTIIGDLVTKFPSDYRSRARVERETARNTRDGLRNRNG